MDSKSDPVNSVLSTPEVREMIMKNLDVLSLINCRLVSKSWNITASSLLKKRPVWIKREWDSEKFGQLYRCVKRGTNFPFCRLDLSITGKRSANLDFKNLTKLFTRCGMTFTHLRAKCGIKWHRIMLKNLLKTTAQLQYLELGELPTYRKTETPEFSLGSLRFLKFSNPFEGRGKRVLEQLIRAAPNLQDIQHVYCHSALQMTALKKVRKFNLVSSMIITNSIETQGFSELAVNPPQLTSLIVLGNDERATQHFLIALKVLLTHNASTLKRLKFYNVMQQLDDLPVFHELEELTFKMNKLGCPNVHGSALFPRLSRSSFPKLNKIRLDTVETEITKKTISDHFWEVCELPMESVDELVLESYCGAAAIKYLAKCFPQVTYITVNYQQCKYGKGERQDSDIWLLRNFPTLRKLHIQGYTFKHEVMDRFLTGIPNEIVAKLESAPKGVLTPWMSEILRPYGSILQLKNLRQFTVTVIPYRHPWSERPLMTMVSIWYALELIPGLRSNFLCCSKSWSRILDHSEGFQNAFESVKDYVTVGPCFCDED